jgi:lipid A 3-O-deacylase
LKKQRAFLVLLMAGWSSFALCQMSSSVTAGSAIAGDPVRAVMQHDPWDRGAFIDGGFGTSGETSDHFLNAGFRLGKVLTDPAGPGILRGQFEYAIQLIPYWQAFTPKTTYTLDAGTPESRQVGTGGTYTGLSITPIILRWNLVHWKRVLPWMQGGGGLIWTNHKFPPNGARGTSVWNFEPQFGLGIHYFVKPKQSITFGANAVHISNASLGDANPGVNATVQLQIGYTWWK